MSNKDYYKVLDIEKNATEEDIKKSYKKLALKYHPDRNQGDLACSEKFKELSEAYTVLSNKDKRSQYDMLGSVDDNFDGEDPFFAFNNIFKQHMSNFMNMQYEESINVGDIFSNISGMPQTSFPFGNVHVRAHIFPTDMFSHNDRINMDIPPEDIEDMHDIPNIHNIKNIFGNFFKDKSKKISKIVNGKPDDIIYNINVSFADIYNIKKKKITISRTRKRNGDYIIKKKKIEIPIYGKEILLEGEGDEFKNYKEKGNVIINIFNDKDNNFKRINEYDILTSKDILINQIYSAFIYELTLPNGEILKVQSEKMNYNKHLIQKINKKGIPYEDDSGDLYIIYKIIFPENFEELIDIKPYKETLTIADDYHTAYNCNLFDIFNNE